MQRTSFPLEKRQLVKVVLDWCLSFQDLEMKFQQEKEEVRISCEKKVAWSTFSPNGHPSRHLNVHLLLRDLSSKPRRGS